MQWTAPSEKDTDNAAFKKRLVDAFGWIRADSGFDFAHLGHAIQ